MTGPFRNQNPLTYVLLFVYGLLLRLPAFLHPSGPVLAQTDGYFYKMLIGPLATVGSLPSILFPISAYILIFAQALLLDGMMNRERLLSKAGRLPAMSYLLLTALIPDWWRFSAPLVASTLIIPVLSLLGATMNNRKAGMLIFYSGLLIGMAALVHFPSVIFFLLPYFAIVSMGPFPPVVWMLGLTGFLLPYYYVFSLQFLFSSWDPGVVWMGFRPSLPSLFSSGTGPWSWAALLLPLVVGLWHLNRHVFRMLIRNRKCWNLYIIQLACASLAPFLFASQGAAIWISIAPGLAAYHANAYIQPRRRWIPELLHWGCLVAVVIAHLSI